MTKEIDFFKHADAVRRAYKAGKKTIKIGDYEFTIERRDYERSFEVSKPIAERGQKIEKEQRSQIESWLILKPKRGLLPVFEIELYHQGNMRTVRTR